MFTVAYRNTVRDHFLALAASDTRIVSGAVVGSLALSDGDRWSDLDLTFAVRDDVPVPAVLADWTRNIVQAFDAAQLFDLPSGPSIYRVFLLPGCLQFDLSFTPATSFGATGPKFRLLFGIAVERPFTPPPAAQELFGYAVHHALRARFCIERGRLWQAAYWIGEARDCALSLACLRRDLPANHGRGYDDLPADVHQAFASTWFGSLERQALLRALGAVIDGLRREAGDTQGLADQVNGQLRELTQIWNG